MSGPPLRRRESGKPISKDRSWYTGMGARLAKSGLGRVVCGCKVWWPGSIRDIGTRTYKGHTRNPVFEERKVECGSEKAGSGVDFEGRDITTLRRTMKRSGQHGRSNSVGSADRRWSHGGIQSAGYRVREMERSSMEIGGWRASIAMYHSAAVRK